MLTKPSSKEFSIDRAARTYFVVDAYRDLPKEPKEQVRLLKLNGQYNMQTGRNSGVTLDAFLENDRLVEQHKKQLYSNAKKVFEQSHKYWKSLSQEQKNQVPEYRIGEARIINEKLDRVSSFLRRPENIDLVEKIVNSPYVGGNPRQRQRHITEEYSSRAHNLNIDNLDPYELGLFSKAIKNTALKVYNKQCMDHQEILKRCRQIEDELSEILYSTKDLQEIAHNISRIEEKFGLEEFDERISIQIEIYPESRIPPALKNADRVLNLIENLKNGFVIKSPSKKLEEIPF